ncbi:MAG: hypothetical protein M3120_10645 [Pseudomonadota bacterium]|nr:hypothetical protein [Pseudomonadota bacterium]
MGNIDEPNLKATLISGDTGAPLRREIFHAAGSVATNNFNLFGWNGNSGVAGFLAGQTTWCARLA